MKVYTANDIPDLREIFNKAIKEVFPGDGEFLDFIEEGDYSSITYDVFPEYSDETYIINRATGEYINWYKLVHTGRDIHTNISTPTYEVLVKWLTDFKHSNVLKYK